METTGIMKRLEVAPDIFGIGTLQIIFGTPYRTSVELCHRPDFPAKKIERYWKISRIGLQKWIQREFKCE